MPRWIVGLALLLTLEACGGGAPAARATPEPPAFDVAAVAAAFKGDCKDPDPIDPLLCQQVKLDSLSGEGTILRVPTTLNSAATARAEAICDEFAVAHFDTNSVDLGYQTIGILDRDGGNAAACSTR